MSRLDSFINRMTAQRDMLNAIRDRVALPDGPILEIGLGNGRTFSHLRENFPGRRIVVFDRQMLAHKSSVPPEGDLVLGEIAETGKTYIGIGAAFVHADIGTGDPEKDAVTLTWLPQMVVGMLASGGYALSGLPLEMPGLERLPVEAHIDPERYYFYRKA
ncbi:MAG: class I SAM-dependent methyltransferase [Rhizobium sp.]|nr:class I SAM-dependent methyltransferase [Rhizobium sp.]